MARHRKRPVSRHGWRAPARRPWQAWRRPQVACALRRVAVTPTFAAGLGVVVAAVLAYQLGAPSFRVSMPPWHGQRCATAGCAPAAGGGSPAVKGGQRLPVSAPKHRAVISAGRSVPSGTGRRAAPDEDAAVTYHTTASWPGGFRGMLTVAFARGYRPGTWLLRFSYPSGRIERVWGQVRVQRQGAHTAVVAQPGAGWALARGQQISVSFQVAGVPGRPGRCFFDRLPCHIG